jgi:hypothetical protein
MATNKVSPIDSDSGVRLKKLFRVFKRSQTSELGAALQALPPGELVQAVTQLSASGELRFVSKKRKSSSLTKFYRYHKENPRVADWFLEKARELKNEEHRKRYGAHALMQKIRWDVNIGVIKTDGFKISNDFNAFYARLILMRDPSLCGLFALKSSAADALVVDGRTWLDFAKEHAQELWPETKKPAGSVHSPSDQSTVS